MTDKPVSSRLASLLERLQGKETLELEIKAARTAIPSSLWPTVSAFANTQGGWIVLGIAEHDESMTIEGVPHASASVQNLHTMLRNTNKISYPACGAHDISIEALEDKQLIVIRVPAAPRRVRPVYINGNVYDGTYIRRNSGDFRCTKQEVDRMMREASDVAADSAILVKYNWDDLDRDTLARYRRRFQTHDPGSPWTSYDDQRFLTAIGGYRRDREMGQQGITVAGLLMFGVDAALREWRTRHLIDYRLVHDPDPDIRWDDRVVWEGNLFGAFETIYPRLTAHLPVPFRLEGAVRSGESEVHVAVREALVNLLVHADYAETQPSLIKCSREGYLFRNPGNSRVPELDLLEGDRSDPRNPILVSMFRFIGLADEAGSGFPKIIRAWRNLGFRMPTISVGSERYEFSLDLRYVHLLRDDDRNWLRLLGNTWTEEEQLALVIARHEGGIDNLKLRSITGQHPTDITKVLGSLRNRGFLEMHGVGRAARYHLGPKAGTEQDVIASFRNDFMSNASTPRLNSDEKSLNSEGIASDSEGIASDSEGIASDSEGIASDSEGMWLILEEIARPAREQTRLEPDERNAIIVQLCAHVPLSLNQLARLMNRSEPYLREALRALVTVGKLRFMYPNQPNHPRQKYVTSN